MSVEQTFISTTTTKFANILLVGHAGKTDLFMHMKHHSVQTNIHSFVCMDFCGNKHMHGWQNWNRMQTHKLPLNVNVYVWTLSVFCLLPSYHSLVHMVIINAYFGRLLPPSEFWWHDGSVYDISFRSENEVKYSFRSVFAYERHLKCTTAHPNEINAKM